MESKLVVGFILIGAIQKSVEAPTFWGAFEKSVEATFGWQSVEILKDEDRHVTIACSKREPIETFEGS